MGYRETEGRQRAKVGRHLIFIDPQHIELNETMTTRKVKNAVQ